MKKRWISLTLLGVSALPFSAGAINSAEIIASALCPDCIRWQVKGICYWLQCGWGGCRVRTSVKVKHYIPVAVVSSYAQTGNNPWSEVSMLGHGIPGVAEGGGTNAQKRSQRKDNLIFKNVDVIGHPALAAPVFNRFMGNLGYTCGTSAKPFMPYLLSTLDAVMWRTGLPESVYPEALIPGRRELGSQSASNMWGNIYPRGGFATQTDDFKAAALMAQRAADIVTRTGQVHIYQTLRDTPHEGYWPPGPVTENTGRDNHQWQRLAPGVSHSCAVFPTDETPQAENGNYAFALWQPYSCCQRRGQKFLGSTDF